MLLPDGTCPRCDPPMRRTTDEKLRLAKEFGDSRLQRTAEREIDLGVATKGAGPQLSPGLASAQEIDHLHDRIDHVQRLVASLSAQIDDLKSVSHDHPPEAPEPAPAT